MVVQRQPLRIRFAGDALRIVFFLIVVGGPLASALQVPRLHPRIVEWALRLVIAISAELILVAVSRDLCPKPKAGSYMPGGNRGYLRHLFSSALSSVAMSPLVRFPFWWLESTRILYLKALGAELSWKASLHETVRIAEPSLISVAEGAQLEAGVALETGFHGAGRLHLAAITIGGGALVGPQSLLLAGATLGHDSRIGAGVLIGSNVRVGVAASVGDGARLEKDVDLGSYTNVGAGAVLGEGVKVGDRSRIAAGAVIKANTQIGERETWEGAPARSVAREPSLVAKT